MIHQKLLNPQSIVVVGASDNIQSPGGKVLYNLIHQPFKGQLFGVNPKLNAVQGINCYQDVNDVPKVDLAIIAVAAKYCPDIVKTLAETKNTKAFIILSAGFSEQDHEGKLLENKIVEIVNANGASLLGPNNIGMFNTHFSGVFTTPIPKLNPQGVDFISGSGATAVFIMEAAMQKGLTFNAVFSVGNSAQIGVEDVLEHMNLTYEKGVSSDIKLLYIESINQPQKLLKHARSLYEKGVRIAAIKSGSSDAGSRAATSHTGAIANADTAVDALFQKAGIIRCYGREELVYVAGVLTYSTLQGKNMAIVTHAGGPAVMLTDALSKNGLTIPKISNPKADELLTQLFSGSSVSNPIDFLATGTAEQLKTILTYCENDFDEIDAIAVIFGSPGLFAVDEVYHVLHQKIKSSQKPIYPILPSVVNVSREIADFVGQGNFAFFDEVLFGEALGKTFANKPLALGNFTKNTAIEQRLKTIVNGQKGYLSPEIIQQIFKTIELPFVEEHIIHSVSDLQHINIKYPVVAKVIGPVHKTDVGGIRLHIQDLETLEKNCHEILQIPDATGVLLQPMLSGMEIYVGAKKEGTFGHTVLCGLGGITIEITKDISVGLAPLSVMEIQNMISKLQVYPILKGYRGKKGINITQFETIISKISDLVGYLPEISELDINPLLANETEIFAVDARIKLE